MRLREEITDELTELLVRASSHMPMTTHLPFKVEGIINKVLDAAVEAAVSRKRGQDMYSWEFDAAVEEAITAINKLRGEK